MTTLRITINMDNDAFGEDPEVEVKRILEDLNQKFAHYGMQDWVLRDINGNSVGAAKVVKEG